MGNKTDFLKSRRKMSLAQSSEFLQNEQRQRAIRTFQNIDNICRGKYGGKISSGGLCWSFRVACSNCRQMSRNGLKSIAYRSFSS
ncbi:hypothetical protein NPIL_286201 [Nephila pilipes]|uniref:Uncharacterized protein n=1 Tax=Nephila pilipes TaxID=299642 RepID=A0A8X6UQC4_NEPPI|nr:hypothetical protein NPIL_286201 [Nephila pilipes]